jgi:hypothetical protein
MATVLTLLIHINLRASFPRQYGLGNGRFHLDTTGARRLACRNYVVAWRPV